MCIEYHIQVNMYHVSAQGVDERMINVHYYYYYHYYYSDTLLCIQYIQLNSLISITRWTTDAAS